MKHETILCKILVVLHTSVAKVRVRLFAWGGCRSLGLGCEAILYDKRKQEADNFNGPFYPCVAFDPSKAILSSYRCRTICHQPLPCTSQSNEGYRSKPNRTLHVYISSLAASLSCTDPSHKLIQVAESTCSQFPTHKSPGHRKTLHEAPASIAGGSACVSHGGINTEESLGWTSMPPTARSLRMDSAALYVSLRDRTISLLSAKQGAP